MADEPVSAIEYIIPNIDSDHFIFSAYMQYTPSVPVVGYVFCEASNEDGTRLGRIEISNDGDSVVIALKIVYEGSEYTFIEQALPSGFGILDPDIWNGLAISINGSIVTCCLCGMTIGDASPVPDPFAGLDRIRCGMMGLGDGNMAMWWDNLRMDDYSDIVFRLTFAGDPGATTWEELARGSLLGTVTNCEIDVAESHHDLSSLRLGVDPYVVGSFYYNDILLIGSAFELSFSFKYEGGNWVTGEDDIITFSIGPKDTVPFLEENITYPNILMGLSGGTDNSPLFFIGCWPHPLISTSPFHIYQTSVDVPKPNVWHDVRIYTQIDTEAPSFTVYFVIDEVEVTKAIVSFATSLFLMMNAFGVSAITGWSGVTKAWITDVKIENNVEYVSPNKEFMAWNFDPMLPTLSATKIQTEILT